MTRGQRLQLMGRRMAAAAVMLLLGGVPAEAGRISLDLTTQAQVTGGELLIQLSVRNSGDEPAHNVTPVLSFGDATVEGEGRSALAPREAMAVEMRAPAAVGSGRWVYRIMIGYADANEYPFHALHVGTVNVGDVPPLQKVAVEDLQAGPVATQGTLEATLKNLTGEANKVTFAVYLPSGIEVAGPVAPVELAAWDTARVSVPLVNRTARPDSSYAVFAAAEYMDGDAHQVALVSTVLPIVAEQSLFSRWRSVLWAAAGVVILLWVAGIVWSMTTRRQKPSVT